uniref:YSIRK-type signal peptide-containing protein n=1 Tax=Streptococcus sp. 2100 TaxID=2582690 RepID=UPI001562CA23
MFYSEKDDREKQLRFSIRKVSFGAASVAVAALYLFMGSGAVSAEEAQAVQSNEEVAADKDSETEKKSENQQPTYAAPAAKEQGSATNTEAGDEGKQESHPETKEEEANSSERSETTTKTQSDEDSVSGDSSSPKSEGEGTRSEEASNKPKVRKRRDASAPPATATDDDPDAHQTYTAPGDGASVDTLANKLRELPATVENEKKLANIDQVGATKNITPGQVSDLDEFGGWKAVNGGKFGVARKTDNGVFPIETVNTVISNNKFKTYLDESSFDRSQNYAFFLGQVRTEKTKDKQVFDNTEYKKYDNGNQGNKGKGIVGYNGIEKTFKAYSSSTGTGVTIAFRTGFTGDIDGNKAAYKVVVMTKAGDGSSLTIYEETFKPTDNIDNDKKKVTKVDAAGIKTFDTNMNPIPSRDELNSKLAQDANKNKLGMNFGTFQSKGIELPPGVTEYTVRISAADNNKLGMGYQIPWEHYALPVVGTGFSVTQDTRKVAKDLSEKVYNKLTESKAEDTKWSTPETKAAYEAKLQEIKEKIDSGASTSDYQTVVGEAVEQWKKLDEGQKIKDKAKKVIEDKLK